MLKIRMLFLRENTYYAVYCLHVGAANAPGLPNLQISSAQLPGTGGATAFRCVIHNNFKVADTVSQRAEEYTREQWEIALRKAKQRATPGKWPVIRRSDF